MLHKNKHDFIMWVKYMCLKLYLGFELLLYNVFKYTHIIIEIYKGFNCKHLIINNFTSSAFERLSKICFLIFYYFCLRFFMRMSKCIIKMALIELIHFLRIYSK